jgi:hypothetical protein
MLPAVIELAGLDGFNGFQIDGAFGTGPQQGRYSSAAFAGDVNGDGFGDLILGRTATGHIAVIFGRRDGFADIADLTALDGVSGFRLDGVSNSAVVASAGDVNGDGLDDLIIGDPQANKGYVVFGRTGGFAPIVDVAALSGSDGFGIVGGVTNGVSVSSAGDINLDGFDDVVVGAHLNGNQRGFAAVIFGHDGPFPATVDTAFFDEAEGFRFQGTRSDSDDDPWLGDWAGYRVAPAGDFNGDGFDDFMIGAAGANSSDSATNPIYKDNGEVYLLFGGAGAFPQNRSEIDGTNGIILRASNAEFSAFGRTLAPAGDVNGDGFADVIVGSSIGAYVYLGAPSNLLGRFRIEGSGIRVGPGGDVNGDGYDDMIVGAPASDVDGFAGVGVSYVVYGAIAFPAVIDPLSLDGVSGFRVEGEAAGQQSGMSVSAAGDINRDGFADLLIGAQRPSSGAATPAWVVFGAGVDVNLAAMRGDNGFRIEGEAQQGLLGDAVSGAGDVNGDGFADLIVGAYGADDTGAAYVVFGGAGGFGQRLAASGLDGANGFKLVGEGVHSGAGKSVSSAGDVNGDGFDDVLVVAPSLFSSMAYDGVAYVLFGKAGGFDADIDLAALDGADGFRINGDAQFGGFRGGLTVASTGDVNGDGLGDIVLGAPRALSSIQGTRGAAYVVFGRQDGFSAEMNLSSLNGTNGFQLSGTLGDELGASVSAGDINGDGFDDLIVGASYSAAGGVAQGGAVYVVFGQRSGFAADLSVSGLNGANGFRIDSESAQAQIGFAVSAAGDVNADGFGDLIIGARRAGPAGAYSGASYVVFGVSSFAADLDLSALTGANGFQINGKATGDQSGVDVSAAGDVNGDGFADLLIGARYADPGGPDSGQSYILFGKAERFGANITLAGLNGASGYQLHGEAAGDRSGSAVAAAGDVNGDGLADVIVGAENAGFNGSLSGSAYVVFGRGPTEAVNYTGGLADQILVGSDFADTLKGGGGDDTLHAKAGNDALDGGAGRDQLLAGDGNDTLSGGRAEDDLDGGSGADRLVGGGGRDNLIGGLGGDRLEGGKGRDIFRWLEAAESSGDGGRDEIVGFVRGEDRLNLAAIDANGNVGDGDQRFRFVGDTHFSGDGRELRVFVVNTTSTRVEADVDGDGAADFSVLLRGVTGIDATDFVL